MVGDNNGLVLVFESWGNNDAWEWELRGVKFVGRDLRGETSRTTSMSYLNGVYYLHTSNAIVIMYRGDGFPWRAVKID